MGQKKIIDFTPGADIDAANVRFFCGVTTESPFVITAYYRDNNDVKRIEEVSSLVSNLTERVGTLYSNSIYRFGGLCKKNAGTMLSDNHRFFAGKKYRFRVSADGVVSADCVFLFSRLDGSGEWKSVAMPAWDGTEKIINVSVDEDKDANIRIYVGPSPLAEFNVVVYEDDVTITDSVEAITDDVKTINTEVFGNESEKVVCDVTKQSLQNSAIEFGSFSFISGNTYKVVASAESAITSSLFHLHVNDGDAYQYRMRLDSNGTYDGSNVEGHFTADHDFTGRVFIWSNAGTTTGVNVRVFVQDQTGLQKSLGEQISQKTTLISGTSVQRRSLTANENDLFFDLDAKQLCAYAGGKWWANRKPVDIENPIVDEVADPDQIEVDGVYYIVHSKATNTSDIGSVGLLKTKDWYNFERIDPAFTDGPITESFWTPDIAVVDGKFTIYTSANSPRRLIAYQADSPLGAWKYKGVLVGNGGQISSPSDTTPIDPEFATDYASGDKYLFFGSYTDLQAKQGRIYAVKLRDDGLACADGSSAVAVASIASEGTTIIYHDGWYYFLGSIGAWGYSSYQVVYGRSRNLLGDYVTKSGERLLDGKYEQLWGTGKTSVIYGRGHGGSPFMDKNGRWYMPVHAWKAGESQASGDLRQLCLFEIKFTADGWLEVDSSTNYGTFVAPNV